MDTHNTDYCTEVDYAYATTAASDDPRIIIDANKTTDAAFYNPTDEEKRYNALREKMYDEVGKKQKAQLEAYRLREKLATLSSDMATRNEAIEKVIELVTMTVKLTLEIYKKICDKVDEERGSYACNFIAEAVLKDINDKAKDFVKQSTSRRRINIPHDPQVTTKKTLNNTPLILNR